jgi:hypothetical protein
MRKREIRKEESTIGFLILSLLILSLDFLGVLGVLGVLAVQSS